MLGGQEEHGGVRDVVEPARLHFEHPDLVAGAETVLDTPEQPGLTIHAHTGQHMTIYTLLLVF